METRAEYWGHVLRLTRRREQEQDIAVLNEKDLVCLICLFHCVRCVVCVFYRFCVHVIVCVRVRVCLCVVLVFPDVLPVRLS